MATPFRGPGGLENININFVQFIYIQHKSVSAANQNSPLTANNGFGHRNYSRPRTPFAFNWAQLPCGKKPARQ